MSEINQDPVDRLTQVESLLAHQDDVIGQLNETVVEMRRELDRLNLQILRQTEKIEWLITNHESRELPPNERPPHY
ncbi:MAG: SlyX family protein [Pirellulaceae bacterium]|jgi:uncharacterized coiled-coil protein SlyX